MKNEANVNKRKFLVFSLILFLIIFVVAAATFTISARQINRSYIEQQLAIASETMRLRLASIVNSELSLVLKLADTPAIRQYFINPTDPELVKIAHSEFEVFQEHFKLKVVFHANDVDKIFYSTVSEPYLIDPDDPVSYWYNLTLYNTETYNFNINYNPEMHQINLWINVPVFGYENGERKSLGMLGTGIDLTEFVDFVGTAYKEFDNNITAFVFNRFDEITTAMDYYLVHDKVRIDDYLGEPGVELIKAAHKLGDGESHSFVFGKNIYLVSSIPSMGWFLAVSYPLPGLLAINESMNILFFGMLFLILLMFIIMNVFNSRSENTLAERNNQLIAANNEAAAASRAKSEFLTTMSHEFRTPLNAILGLSEIVLQGDLKEADRENIAQIHQSGSVLMGIIGDILDLSKIESGKFELVNEEYDIAALISDTVNLNKVRIGSKPVIFTLKIDKDFPRKLKGDELRIKQVLNNLLSNAIKYTSEGIVKLAISKEQLANNKVKIRFVISDTGIGIKPEDIDKLFTQYTKLNAEANRLVEGTGLGLAITKNIVEAMGGTITVESEYGKGSVFTAEIIQQIADMTPIGEETAAALRDFIYAPVRKDETINYQSYKGCRVMAVDDKLENLLVIRGLLKPYDIKADCAASGQEAIELAMQAVDSGGYDLIFMDHMMPGMDGIKSAKALRSIQGFAETPIIVLTANALPGMREYYLEKGFNDYLSKPVNPKALDEVIKRNLSTN